MRWISVVHDSLDDRAFDLILHQARGLPEEALPRLRMLLHKATPRLIFTKLQFMRELLRLFQGASREILVQEIGYQSRRHAGGVYAGDFEAMMADEVQRYRDAVDGLPDDPELEDVVREMRRYL
jgi:hypothetical protein